MTQRPIRLLGAASSPRTSLSGLSSVNGRLGLWLQDSPAVLLLLRLAFAGRLRAAATPPDGLPLPDTTATLNWQQLSFADDEGSAALIAAYQTTGQADLFTGLRVSALQLTLAPAAPPVAEFTLIGRQHSLIEEADRPSLQSVPSGPVALPPARLLVRVDGRAVPFPVQMRFNLSRAPARPHSTGPDPA